MSEVEITYTGNKECTVLSTKTGKRVAVACPTAKVEELGPGSLVGAGLGSCMLISMASYAERHGLDVVGAQASVNVSFGGKPQSRISAIEVSVRVPNYFGKEERVNLEKAAGACPIKHSFRSDTAISTHFEFDTALSGSISGTSVQHYF